MKAIVVYYSLEGNTKYVAEQIAALTGADVLRLEPVKGYPTGKASKYFWGGKSVIFGEKPELKSYSFHQEDYDVILIGTPIWAGSYAPPIKSFINENDLKDKKIGLFTCSGSQGPEKCLKKLKDEIGYQNDIPVMNLVEPARMPAKENELKIKQFCTDLIG